MLVDTMRENRCLDIDSRIKYELLPPQVIVKKYIENEKDCNYEVFLMELLNESAHFQQLSGGECYHKL